MVPVIFPLVPQHDYKPLSARNSQHGRLTVLNRAGRMRSVTMLLRIGHFSVAWLPFFVAGQAYYLSDLSTN